MKLTVLLALCIAFSISLFSQTYKIGHRQITWVDSSRSNRSVMFEIYYPSAKTGDNTSVIGNGKKFPLVVFGHGYQLTYSDYLWLKDSLVPRGFFLAFPRTEEKTFPSHSDFAKDYAFIIKRFDATKTQTNTWYRSKLNGKYAVAGHSMGGGSSLLSVQYNSKIKAVFNFAAAETNPSAITACSQIKIPALIFGGGSDCVAPPSSNQLSMYNNIQNYCKTYIQITAAKHCQWANNASICRVGEFFCSPSTASPKATFTTTFSLLLPWLNEFLNSNTSEGQRFQTLLGKTSGMTYQQNCTLNSNGFVENDINGEKNNLIKVYPTLLNAGSFINVGLPAIQHATVLQVLNQSGEIVLTKKISQSNMQTLQLNTDRLRQGIYFIVVNDGAVKYKTNFMIE